MRVRELRPTFILLGRHTVLHPVREGCHVICMDKPSNYPNYSKRAVLPNICYIHPNQYNSRRPALKTETTSILQPGFKLIFGTHTHFSQKQFKEQSTLIRTIFQTGKTFQFQQIFKLGTQWWLCQKNNYKDKVNPIEAVYVRMGAAPQISL